ncbi:DUF3347 domain-containing protein [Daejeonia sp. YH14]|uniref:DUF3347 domain-containing protein n=1 Tax=Daejeonia sp. YH14 TaxID=3439042 RepID=UPI003F498630
MKKNILSLIMGLGTVGMMNAQKADASLKKAYQDYLNIKNALVADNTSATAASANQFIKDIGAADYKTVSEGNAEILRKQATAVSQARDIKAQRAAFHHLSDNMIALAEKLKLSDQPVYVQYCPMADASWLSSDSEIKNPYYGKMMLSCGKVTKELK